MSPCSLSSISALTASRNWENRIGLALIKDIYGWEIGVVSTCSLSSISALSNEGKRIGLALIKDIYGWE